MMTHVPHYTDQFPDVQPPSKVKTENYRELLCIIFRNEETIQTQFPSPNQSSEMLKAVNNNLQQASAFTIQNVADPPFKKKTEYKIMRPSLVIDTVTGL